MRTPIRTQAKTQAKAQPNMTPMLDIVFIMLIFFIVTASFVRENGIEPNFQKPLSGPKSPTEPIGFSVDAQSRIFHAGRMIDHWSIEAIVKEAHTARPNAPVLVETHKDAAMGRFIRIHDEAVKAGMPAGKVAIVVRPE
ncbi:ExbD/TolR family protein [Kordiimonas lipolytica]|uniref:ExbD/TolR family protein n=1 Tax=Kordiimonas lipolytica TaxID=1662421 RepID=A0ABV8UEL7_9PROT|nr:biopolymer transporter ExbD [Kordiimonas lipolytica]